MSCFSRPSRILAIRAATCSLISVGSSKSSLMMSWWKAAIASIFACASDKFPLLHAATTSSKALVILPIALTTTTMGRWLNWPMILATFRTLCASFTDAPPNLKTSGVLICIALIVLWSTFPNATQGRGKRRIFYKSSTLDRSILVRSIPCVLHSALLPP